MIRFLLKHGVYRKGKICKFILYQKFSRRRAAQSVSCIGLRPMSSTYINTMQNKLAMKFSCEAATA